MKQLLMLLLLLLLVGRLLLVVPPPLVADADVPAPAPTRGFGFGLGLGLGAPSVRAVALRGARGVRRKLTSFLERTWAGSDTLKRVLRKGTK